jgi:hypothetical protein
MAGAIRGLSTKLASIDVVPDAAILASLDEMKA